MDVVQAMDHFNFIGTSHYSSAPTSPRGASEYCDFDELLLAAGASYSGEYKSLAAVPFAWEEKPGVPKTLGTMGTLGLADEDDFSFDVSCEFDSVSVPAEDLFAGGVIKTVGTETRGKVERERGRERGFSSSRLSSSRSRRTRSLSPLGVSDYRREQQQLQQLRQKPSTATTTMTTTHVCSSDNGSKRWSFRDLFLFRSASDGSVMEKYPLKKYFTTNRKPDQDFKNTSESGSFSKRKGRVSAHELHYNLNRANSNDLKKKTYLPYKQGILGGFSFNS